MKEIFFTVGPSQLYPTVPHHIKTALQKNIYSLSHRSKTFQDVYADTAQNLRQLLSIPKTHHIFFTSCALEAMERTIANTVEKKSFHFVNGSFSHEFYQIAVDLKKEAFRCNGEGFDFTAVEIPKDVELICLVQNETSTGISLPLENIYTLKRSHPSSLIAIDIVSAVPYVTVDFSLIDIAFFSVQKGFGLPAGLGVLIVNERALEKAQWMEKKGNQIGSYHNFIKLHELEKVFQTRETPNVGNIYLLNKVANDMLTVGIENIQQETEEKAKRIYEFFDNHPQYKPSVQEPFRSKTTIVLDAQGNSAQVATALAQKGIIVAQGYGKRKDLYIRIANFPTHSLTQVKKLLSVFPQS